MQTPIDHTRLTRSGGLPAAGRPTNGRSAIFDVEQPSPDPRATALDRERVGDHLGVREIDGHRPDGVETRFVPSRAPGTHRRRTRGGTDRDKGGTIFGTDDRYLFQDASFPWRTTGKVRTAGGFGSGTTIGPRHVLTASHVVN